ncbi:MAG: hypothetical protein MRY83_03880 [Flavobacteriales bacterium]|nr:hypothetical protein [Flavobacteriales bacterium]
MRSASMIMTLTLLWVSCANDKVCWIAACECSQDKPQLKWASDALDIELDAYECYDYIGRKEKSWGFVLKNNSVEPISNWSISFDGKFRIQTPYYRMKDTIAPGDSLWLVWNHDVPGPMVIDQKDNYMNSQWSPDHSLEFSWSDHKYIFDWKNSPIDSID